MANVELARYKLLERPLPVQRDLITDQTHRADLEPNWIAIIRGLFGLFVLSLFWKNRLVFVDEPKNLI